MTIDDTKSLEADPTVETAPTPAQPAASSEAPEQTSAPAAAAAPESAPESVPAPADHASSPVPESSGNAVEVADDAALFDSYFESSAESDTTYRKFTKGERIKAKIVQVEQDKVFVDIGTKSEAIIPLAELGANLSDATTAFNVGDEIDVVVVKTEGGDRQPIVSKRKADFEQVWTRIEEAKESGEMVTATVLERIKGGLVVDLGVRGFVPATHVGSGKLRSLDRYVGQELQLKVIEIDRERKKVVLSNREAEEQRRTELRDSIFNTVHVADVLEGTIRRLTDYGAFVDLGGVDGLLHISEMSWSRITHPKELFKEGQVIKVQVLRLDPQNGKISLGHRQVLPDPWNLVKENYKIGQTIQVSITRLVASGAFIKLPEGAEAFMPVSEMSEQRVRKPEDVLQEGAAVDARIIDLKPDQRRMVLSLREGSSIGYHADIPTQERGGQRGGPGQRPGARGGKRGRSRDSFDDFEETDKRRGIASSGVTIGERLGQLRGFFRPVEEHAEEGKSDSGDAPKASEAQAGEPAESAAASSEK